MKKVKRTKGVFVELTLSWEEWELLLAVIASARATRLLTDAEQSSLKNLKTILRRKRCYHEQD